MSSRPRARLAAIAGAVLVGCGCAGCAGWPPARGGGGVDVVDPGPRGKTRALWLENKDLRAELASLDAQIDFLEGDGEADAYAPADLQRARRRSLRARKEIAGGMHGAAALDLVRLEARIAVIEAKLHRRAQLEKLEVSIFDLRESLHAAHAVAGEPSACASSIDFAALKREIRAVGALSQDGALEAELQSDVEAFQRECSHARVKAMSAKLDNFRRSLKRNGEMGSS